MSAIGEYTIAGLQAINTGIFLKHNKRKSTFRRKKPCKAYAEAEALANNFNHADMKCIDAIIEKQNTIKSQEEI